MGSSVNMHRARMKKAEYEAFKKNLNKEYFYNFYLNNCNDYICVEFNLNLSTLYKLIKDLGIELTDEQKKQRNKIASEQKCIETFGATNPFAVKEVQERVKETNTARYGVENVFASEKIKSKIRQTILDKYGVENVLQSTEIKQKIKNTCLELYGVDNYAKTPECQEKAKNTMLERYGRANVGQFGSQESINGILKKYGTIYTGSLPEIKEKIKQTNLARYGVEYYTLTHDFNKNRKKRYGYKDFYFDSLPELAVWIYCVDNGIEIRRNPCYFNYNFEGKNHRYFPDFEINGQLVEIKGDHFFKENGTMQNPFDSNQDALYEAKHQCGLQNNVQFWRSAEYEKYLQYFVENYDVADYVFKKSDEVI